MPEPILLAHLDAPSSDSRAREAVGGSFTVEEASGSGPGYLHVHYADDEAWYILEGSLTFRFENRRVEAPAGTSVFVPAGVPHDYYETARPTRYLMILTPRLRELIAALHAAPLRERPTLLRQFESAIVE